MRYHTKGNSNQSGSNAYSISGRIGRNESNKEDREASSRFSSAPNVRNVRAADRSTKEEGRQDVIIEAQERSDDKEYRILYDEIERINRILQSGSSREAVGTISLTSSFNKDAEISPSMHEKIMRLIKAMMPNSTPDQKNAFIRDLFDMGIRVGQNKQDRSQIQQQSSSYEVGYESMFEESNSIVESVSGKEQKISTLDEFDDGSNSIIEKSGENYLEEDLYASTKGANSSTEVENQWDELRSKALNDNSGRISSAAVSLSSEIEAALIEDCVATGIDSSPKSRALAGFQKNLIDGEQCSVHHRLTPAYQCPQAEDNSNFSKRRGQPDDTSGHQPMRPRCTHPNRFEIETASETNSILEDNEIDADDIPSIDEGTSTTSRKKDDGIGLEQPGKGTFFDVSEPANSFQSEETQLTKKVSQDMQSFNFKRDNSCKTQRQRRAPATSEGTVDREEENYPKIEVTLHQSSGDKSPSAKTSNLGLVESTTRSHPGDISIVDESIGDSDMIVGDKPGISSSSSEIDDMSGSDGENAELCDATTTDSFRHLTSLIHVKSSLTIGTEFASPKTDQKKAEYSFFQNVDLSVGETNGQSFTDKRQESEAEIQPSWRLDPSKSLSDFELQILSVETGETTSYFVHKHMMAVGPRSSDYMNEAFRCENSSTFQVTLDEKTFPLVPKILDFIYHRENEINITTESAVPLRQLGKMLKITHIEVKAATFILNEMDISNLAQYVADSCHFNDEEVMNAVVERCCANIEAIPITDRLWIVMEPELFLRIISSKSFDRDTLSKHLSVLLTEYLELHQYEINIDLFATLTSEKIIPTMDRNAAMPLIELCQFYDSSRECEALQKRCAYTVASYWDTTSQTDRQRLFSLLRNLPSSLTVDFLEIVESGSCTTEKRRNELETEHTTIVAGIPPKAMSIEDLCENALREGNEKELLSWRMDPQNSYSDWDLHIKSLNHEETQVYHVHKHILAVGKHKGSFFAQSFNSEEVSLEQKGCTTILLDCEAASVVPFVLDFVYLGGDELEISNENSVPLHYVARVLGISTLIETTTSFIENDISLDNIVDYIIDAGYYKDDKTMTLATRKCTQEITSICVDSDILQNIEPEIFEEIVSSEDIKQSEKCHVNVLITKYFSLHDFQGNSAENLLKCIDVDQVDQFSALTLLNILSGSKNYEGVETFEKMKKSCAFVITENWADLTEDNIRREEVFSMFPSLNADLLTTMFDAVDCKYRIEYTESMTIQGELVDRYRKQAAEANRLRHEEVASLRRELEARTTKMLSLQKALEGKLEQVDRALNRRTTRGTAAITSMPWPRKTTKNFDVLRDEKRTILEALSEQHTVLISPQSERQESFPDSDKSEDEDNDWYQDEEGDKNKAIEMEKKKEGVFSPTHSGDFEKTDAGGVQNNISDEQSTCTTKEQVKSGIMGCC